MSLIDGLVNVKVLFFAKAKELVGRREVSVEIPQQISGINLLHFICEKFELNRLMCNVILALNENWLDLDSDVILKEGDELAIIPPLSGVTMNFVKLTKDKLYVEAIYNVVCSPEFGAVSLFVGTTRNNFEGKTVTKLEYEAYEQMAIKSLENLCLKIRDKFGVGNIAIYHRLGDVPIQDASVVIAISSTHRQAALSAVPYAIDALKATIPIWKKEIYDNDQPPEWKQNSELKEGFPGSDADVCQPLNTYEEVVETDVGNEVPSHLIQVKADLKEINRRISSFICRKRQQIDERNVEKFFSEMPEASEGESGTCARVSAALKRRKDSKSHLKVHRVANAIGPQTHAAGSECGQLQGLGLRQDQEPRPGCSASGRSIMCPPGAEERISNAETFLNVGKKSSDVFSRLKAIEDKILFLESISPEYFDLRKEEPKVLFPRIGCISKRTYSFTELDTKMQELEAKLQKKVDRW